jgi:outer membrane protein OmpA-like peptidoglycan-associated protein
VRPVRAPGGERDEERAEAPASQSAAPHVPLEALARLPAVPPGRGGAVAVAALVRRAGAALGNHALQRALAPEPAVSGRPSGPVLARRLIATGDVNRFRALAEPAAGLQLAHDPATNQVTAVGTLVDPPTSPSFAAELTQIMDDPVQDAEVHFGAGQPGVVGGAFPVPPDLTGSRIQRIDLDDMEAMEAGVPGFGVTALAHELAENYEAHSHVPAAGTNLFPGAHRAGIQAENAVISELVAPGGRIAERGFTDPSGAIRVAFDYENYYIVVDVSPSSLATGGTDFQVTGTRQAARNPVSTHTIDSFATGSDALPGGAGAAVAAAVADLQAHNNSTAIIEGFTDSVGSAGVNSPLSERRAETVRGAIRGLDATLGGALHRVGRGATSFVAGNATEADRARNRRVTITITEPAP